MRRAQSLWLCAIILHMVSAQYAVPPTKGKKHRTTTTSTEGPGGFNNEITGPLPVQPQSQHENRPTPSEGDFWWQGPNSPFKSGSQPPSGCGELPGCVGPPSGCVGGTGCGSPVGPIHSFSQPHSSAPSKPVDISQNPFLSSAILRKPLPQSPQGCQGLSESCQYPIGPNIPDGTGSFSQKPLQPTGSPQSSSPGHADQQYLGQQYPQPLGQPRPPSVQPEQHLGQLVPLRPHCDLIGHACVPSSMCSEGVVTPNGMFQIRNLQVKECIPGLEACCRMIPGSLVGGFTPSPVSGYNAGQKPYTGPINTTPFPGCAAALKCVAEMYCTAEGVMSNTPVFLNREQAENKVPLTDCQDPDTGIIGKCCRDPNYKDPWPAGMMMKPSVDFDDGQYHGEGDSPNVRPPNNYFSSTPKPFPPTFPERNTDSENSGTNSIPGTSNQPQSTLSRQPDQQTVGSHYQPGVKPPGSLQNVHRPMAVPSYQPVQPTLVSPYQPGQPIPGSSYQPSQPTPVFSQEHGQLTPGLPSQLSKPTSSNNPQQSGQPTFGSPYQPIQHIPESSHQPGEYTGESPYHPPQSTPGSPYQPGQSTSGSTYQESKPTSRFPQQPGQTTLGLPQKPVEPTSGFPQQPDQASLGSPYQSGQSTTGPTYQPGQTTLGSPYQPSLPTSGSLYQSGAPIPSSPYQPDLPTQKQPDFPNQQTDYNLPSHPGQNQPTSAQGYPDEGHAPGSSCGIRRSGPPGHVAGFGEFPWQALIMSAGNRSLLCGAAIVADNMVLTAAHCVNKLWARDLLVKAGEWKMLGQNPKPSQVRAASAIARHPAFDSGSLAKDLAVLILDQPFTFDVHVDKICIPSSLGSEYYQRPGQNCVITGWGKNSLSGPVQNADLHKVDVNVIPVKQCEDKLKTSQNFGKYFILNKGFSCALPPTPSDICKVDLGSAVSCAREDGYYEVAGISSWDVACPTQQPLPTVFATSDARWLEAVLSTPIPVLQEQERQYNQGLKQGEGVDGLETEDKPGFSQGYGK